MGTSLKSSVRNRLILAAHSIGSDESGRCSQSRNKSGDRSTRVARSPLIESDWTGLVMKHSKATHTKRQLENDVALRERTDTTAGVSVRIRAAQGAFSGDPKAQVVTVCGCGLVAAAQRVTRGVSACPNGCPWACPRSVPPSL